MRKVFSFRQTKSSSNKLDNLLVKSVESSPEQSSAAAAAATATAGGVAASGDKGDKENNTASNVEALICWLYVSRTASVGQNGQIVVEAQLPRRNLEEAIRATEPSARWNVSETHCGLIAGFARESDADKLLQREDFGRIFQTPVQVARFCDRDSRHRQAVLLRDVPAAIPLQDIDSALARQGIASGAIERLKHYVRVECSGVTFCAPVQSVCKPDRSNSL
ncbi:hypothetical protein TKK_0006749 [Trichogramma kaykai]